MSLNFTSFMDRLRSLGIVLTLGPDCNLVADCPAGIANTELLSELREYKPEIITHLRHENQEEICARFWKPEDGRVFESDAFALDTETELIDERRPESIPRFVIAGVCDGKSVYLLTGGTLVDFFRLHEDLTIIMHNAAFDLATLSQAVGGEYDVYSLVEMGRVRDTMILHRLYELATSGDSGMAGSSLADSCRKHLNLTVAKEEKDTTGKTVRTNFGEWIDRQEELPKEYIDYLVGDIDATYRLYRRLQTLYRELWCQILRGHPFGFVDEQHLREAWKKYGPLTHDLQLKAAIVLDAVKRNGLHIDMVRLAAFRQELEAGRKDVLKELLAYGYRPGVGSSKALQDILNRQEENNKEIRFPRTETGKISTKADSLEEFAADIPFIGLYLRLKTIEKLLGSFLDKMQKGILHPTFDILKNTGRTSAFGDISAQNLPRDERVRGLFIPASGNVFIDADYAAIEMATLGQAMISQFGGCSAMAEAINNGQDLHRLIASRLTGKPEKEITAEERQKAKAVNFGLPGGMGVTTLRQYAKTNYKTDLTETEAEQLMNVWFDTFPEMRRFLDKGGDLGEDIARILQINGTDYALVTSNHMATDVDKTGTLGWMARKVFSEESPQSKGGRFYTDAECDYFWKRLDTVVNRLSKKHRDSVRDRIPSPGLASAVSDLAGQADVLTLTGRLRASASYCAGHNSIFQGAAADGAKLAMWKLWRNGFRIVNFIHDEFLIEVQEHSNHAKEAEAVKRLMIEGMKEVVTDVNISVEYAVAHCWSKEAKAKVEYDTDGRLVVSHASAIEIASMKQYADPVAKLVADEPNSETPPNSTANRRKKTVQLKDMSWEDVLNLPAAKQVQWFDVKIRQQLKTYTSDVRDRLGYILTMITDDIGDGQA